MPILVDDRTEAQKQTHRLAVVGTDRFLSNWFKFDKNCNIVPDNNVSYAGWAFEDGQEATVFAEIDSRSDMERVRVVCLDGYRPKADHTHIYVYKKPTRRIYE